MKKLFYIPLFALLCACMNDELFISETPVESSVNVSVSDFVNDDGTRTAFTETASGFSFSWSQGDQLGIFPDDNYQTCWTIKEISDAKNASFSGGSWQLVNGNTYYAYYPFSADNGTVQTPTISCDYTSQYISGLNSTSNIGDADYMYASATTAEDGKTNFALSHLGCVLKISLNLTEGRTYSKLTLSTSSALIPAKSSFNIKSGSSTPSETVSSFDVDLANIKVTTSGSAAFYVMMPPCDLSSSGLTATLTYADGTEETSFTGKNMVAGKAYAYTASDLSATSAVGENQTYRIRGANGIDCPMPEAVDMGLPSGKKWASFNIGASKIEDCGLYFAWGETIGYSPSDGHSFDWNNYKFFLDCELVDEPRFTKYVPYPSRGVVDNKTILESEDDAATFNLGSPWSIPSMEDVDELISNCTFSHTSINGIEGYLLTASNSNSIFFPCSGYYPKSTTDYYSSWSVCWINSILVGIECGEDDSWAAWGFAFTPNTSFSDWSYFSNMRACGLCVRAIYSK